MRCNGKKKKPLVCPAYEVVITMKRKALFIIQLLALSAVVYGQNLQNSWHGISPIHSSREDVERKFGKPIKTRRGIYYQSFYDFSDARITVTYSTGPCDSETGSEWNLSKDTVTNIHVVPRNKLNVTKLKEYFRIEFESFADPHMPNSVNYVSADGSVRFVVSESKGETVNRFSLYPTNEQEKDFLCQLKK